MAPTVLFFGGTGQISASCVADAVASGFDVTILNRGASSLRTIPDAVHHLRADLTDNASMAAALRGKTFDVACDFFSFDTARLTRNIGLLKGSVGQYVFISSASAYQKPVGSLPITESTPLHNPYWDYSRAKIACEDLLVGLYRAEGFPMTIVRPSHTYDEFGIPLEGGWTTLARMRAGKPVIVHGDGTSLWTLTHATDFAYMFTALLAQPKAYGNAYHITGDEVLPWNAIFTAFADALNVEANLVHVASETIARAIPALGPGLLGDKSHSVVFDNTKIRALRPGFAQRVPFAEGARRIVAAYDAHPALQQIDPELDAAFDSLVAPTLR